MKASSLAASAISAGGHSAPATKPSLFAGGASLSIVKTAKDDATYAKTVHSNNEISKFASRKDLDSALALYNEALVGGYFNTHTFCSMINAYVRCGLVSEAVAVMAEMKRHKYKPDTVSFTTIMKGFCNDSDITKAYSLFRDMKLAQPDEVIPNIRTVNTFLRGCVSTGEVILAEKVFLQCKEWNVVPDISTFEYLGQMYCQSLNLDKALPLLGRISKDPASAIGLAAINVNVARMKAILGDWKVSRRYINAASEYIKIDEAYDGDDAAAKYEDVDGNLDEGREKGEKKPSAAGGGKRAWHTKDDSDNSRKESLDRFRVHRRNELRHDIVLLEAFISTASFSSNSSNSNCDSVEDKLAAAAKVLPMIARTLCFFQLSKPVDDKKKKQKRKEDKKNKQKEAAPVIQTIGRDDCDADIIAKLEANEKAEARIEEMKQEEADRAETERVSNIKQNFLDTYYGRLGLLVLLKHLEQLTSSKLSVSQRVVQMLDSLIASCLSETGKFDFVAFDSKIVTDFTPRAIDLYSKSKSSAVSTSSNSNSSNSNSYSKSDGKSNSNSSNSNSNSNSNSKNISADIVDMMVTNEKKEKKDKKEKNSSKHNTDMDLGNSELSFNGGSRERRRPLKLEICSGAGEWAVAQAQQDPASHWMTLELRFDRAHQTMSKAIYANLENLTVLCGDANKVINNNIPDNSIQQVFINHPEPPQQTGHTLESQGRHLLTKRFFKEVFRILQPEGTLTIVTDNNWYARYLLRQFSTTAYPREFQSIKIEASSSSSSLSSSSTSSSSSKDWSKLESEGDIDLFEGLPGLQCGHVVEASSYFDRLWKGEKITDRYFFFLRKHHVASGALGPQGSIKPNSVSSISVGKGRSDTKGSKFLSSSDSNNGKSSHRDAHKDSNGSKKRPLSSSQSQAQPSSVPILATQEPAVLNIRGRFKGTALTVDASETKTKKIKFDDGE